MVGTGARRGSICSKHFSRLRDASVKSASDSRRGFALRQSAACRSIDKLLLNSLTIDCSGTDELTQRECGLIQRAVARPVTRNGDSAKFSVQGDLHVLGQ